MVVTTTISDFDEHLRCTFASRYSQASLPRHPHSHEAYDLRGCSGTNFRHKKSWCSDSVVIADGVRAPASSQNQSRHLDVTPGGQLGFTERALSAAAFLSIILINPQDVVKGYKNIMENCMKNATLLKEGITKTGLFDIVSKDVGVPLVAFSLKDSSRYTVFQISESLRRFGWIVPAYTMPPNAEHVAVLRVVIREDFSHGLAERLVSNVVKVLEEMEALPPRVSVKEAHVSLGEAGHMGKEELKKEIGETEKDICSYWRRISDKKISGVC